MTKPPVEPPEPIAVTDKTLSSASMAGVPWDAIVKIITALTPILLAIMTYFTIVNGDQAKTAQETAEQTRKEMVKNDSVTAVVLDTIHRIVNAERTRREAQNEGLRALLEKNKIPVPKGLVSADPDQPVHPER